MQVLDMVVKLDPDIFAIHNGVSIQLPANGSLGGSSIGPQHPYERFGLHSSLLTMTPAHLWLLWAINQL